MHPFLSHVFPLGISAHSRTDNLEEQFYPGKLPEKVTKRNKQDIH